jgi:thiamine-monophosphate kinase
MGGTPRFALVSLVISRRTPRRWVEEFYAGLLDLAKRFGVTLIGGDTAVVPRSTWADVIVCGEAPARRALLRSGARPGDHIFVSGHLGLSALGLRLLNQQRQAARNLPAVPIRPAAAADDALLAHLYPEPRCALGSFLARRRLASAMIDVSDGLSTDLAHLCAASGVGALLWGNEIPVPIVGAAVAAASPLPPPRRGSRGSASAQASRAAELNLLRLALDGGEDYELLFTVPPRKVRRVPRHYQGVRLNYIGQIQRSKGLALLRVDGAKRVLQPAGWDHFRNRKN